MSSPSRVHARLHGLVVSLALLLFAAGCGGSGGSGGPSIPVAAAAALDGQVALSWSAVPGASTYTVYRGTATGLSSASPGAVPGIVGLGTVVTGLSNGTLYYFAVSAIVGGVETSLSAEVTATPVKTAFRVVETSPDVSALSVPTNASISFTFSSPVSPATAGPATVAFHSGSLHTPTSTPFTLSLDASLTTLTVSPTSPLAPSSDFRVTLASTVTGANGASLPGPFLLRFHTAAAPVTTPLTVASVSPANGATNLPPSTYFEMTFERDVAPGSVGPATFSLSRNGVPVGRTVTQRSSRVVRVTPNAPLGDGADYEVAAEPGVTDTAGNGLGARVAANESTAATPPAAGTTAFMLYVNSAGDALESDLVRDLNAWEAAGGSSRDPKVRMYAQLDAANAQFAPKVPATPFHIKVGQDANRDQVQNTPLRAVPAGDLTTAAAVSDFILANRADFAATRNVLVFSDHGMNYQGSNAANGNQRIELSEMVTALTTARNAGVEFDVIVYDVCVMGGWEDLALIAPFAKYVVAGETTTTGMEWEAFFTQTFFPAIGTETLPLLKDLVDKTVASGSRGEPNDFFVYDCAKLTALKNAAVAFYAQLDAALTANTITAASFSDAFGRSLPLEIFTGGEKELCDFARLCENLAQVPGAPVALTNAGTAVVAAIRDAVVHARTSAAWAKLSGVSCALGPVDGAVYGPVLNQISAGMVDPTVQLAAKRTGEFAAPGDRPAASNTRSLNLVGPTPAAPTELDVGCTNTTGAVMYACVSQLTAPNVFTLRGVTQWTSDPTATTEWRWDGTLLRLTVGATSGFVAGSPVDFDSNLIAVDAELTEASTGAVTPAVIFIDVTTLEVESVFTDALGTGKGLGRASLEAGDTLRLVEFVWNEATQDATEALGATVFTVGAAGLDSLVVTRVAAPSGSYEFGVIVTDPAGHDDETSVTVTVP